MSSIGIKGIKQENDTVKFLLHIEQPFKNYGFKQGFIRQVDIKPIEFEQLLFQVVRFSRIPIGFYETKLIGCDFMLNVPISHPIDSGRIACEVFFLDASDIQVGHAETGLLIATSQEKLREVERHDSLRAIEKMKDFKKEEQ